MSHYLATILSVDHSQLTMLVDVHADVLHRLKTFFLNLDFFYKFLCNCLLAVVVDTDVHRQVFPMAVHLSVLKYINVTTK